MFAKFLSPNVLLSASMTNTIQRTQRSSTPTQNGLSALQQVGLRLSVPLWAGGVYRPYEQSTQQCRDRTHLRVTAMKEALQVYRNALSAGYEIYPLESETVIQLGGAVHCTAIGFSP